MCSGLIGRSGAIAGRMACILAVALLACASSVHSQVIEEGGFPVKGGNNSGGSFSLSCPPRPVAQAGESVLLSCTATGVPEEGVRYGWESLSGDGLHLLSASDELSPLFTAPVSGVSSEYAYRLTAMAVGIYRTAPVTVSVEENISGESSGVTVVQEECDPFTIPDELGEGCLEGKAPVPFGFGAEEEGGFLFPEAPGLPDRPAGPVRGGGSGREAPPRLECPVAVFLEELETGSIECYAWDAAGEEYLEYSWEPVGSTTRDYLENPRLLPEDAPNPSVVAPEAPRYDTLESFLSGDRVLRYRYRLTATSRATGLSSREEVEVFVSSSRPSVYCPLEVVVKEGATTQLDCEGVDPLSSRMDYDEEAASILWEWEGLWGTSTAPLAAKDLSSPLFTAPLGSAGEEYHYIASMTTSASGVTRTARRRVTVSVVRGQEDEQASGIDDVTEDVTITVKNKPSITVTCEDSLYEVDEGADDIELECEASGASGDDPDYTWSWSPTTNLTGHDTATPTFDVPANVDKDTTWTYTVTASAANADDGTKTVTVTVSDTDPGITCRDRVVLAGASNISMDCRVTNEPDGATYAWTATGSTSGTDELSSTTILRPIFDPPDNVDADTTTYEYTVTLSATDIDNVADDVTITVLNNKPSVTCTGSDSEVYEGSDNITLACTVTNVPSGATYRWGLNTGLSMNTTLLDRFILKLSPNISLTPTFNTPANVDADTKYVFKLDIMIPGERPVVILAAITITVLNKPSITVTCADSPYEVDEGADDIDLECEASGAPGDYTWSWSPTTNLTGHDTEMPTFDVAAEVDDHTTYTYTVTASATNAESDTTEVTVTVSDKDFGITCTDPDPVYEGDAPFILDCTLRNVPADATLNWTIGGVNVDGITSSPGVYLMTNARSTRPNFIPPVNVDADTTYQFTLTGSAADIDDVTENVNVTVKNKPSITVTCADSPYEVDEGADDIDLECEASGASGDDPDYTWSWSLTANLTDHNTATPTFDVPANVDKDTTYTYTVTASATNAHDGTETVTVTVSNKDTALTCRDSEVYEGAADITLDCTAENEPSDAAYAWAPQGSTSGTSELSSTTILAPTFDVPDNISADTDYEYTVTLSATGISSLTEDVTITVKNKPSITVTCEDSPYEVNEDADDIDLECSASGAPGDSPEYSYVWTARGDTPDTALLSATNIASPTFAVPDDVDKDTTWTYTVTASAANSDDGTKTVTVTVSDTDPALTCRDSEVYEGAADIILDCTAENEPSGATYAWTALSGTDDLSSTTILGPTFDVPDNVVADTTYEYTVTLSASGIDDVTEDVTITVKNKPSITVTCADSPYEVDEGADDIDLECGASGASGDDPDYTWSWSPTANLTDHNTATPTFDVPANVDKDTTYTYTVTASATNSDDGTKTVTVTVSDTAPVLTCRDSEVYESAVSLTLDCTAENEPSDVTYAWAARGSTSDTDNLTNSDSLRATFSVPDNVAADTDYEYTVTLSATGTDDLTEDVTVTVLNTPLVAIDCGPPGLPVVIAENTSYTFSCSASGIRSGDPQYTYVWTARDPTPNTNQLSRTDISSPVFTAPDISVPYMDFHYTVTANAENIGNNMSKSSLDLDIRVTRRDGGAPAITCNSPDPVYEAWDDIVLFCWAADEPSGATYAWAARGSTPGTDELSSTTIVRPTFDVPDSVSTDTDYEYRVTLSAPGIDDVTEDITVTVLNRHSLVIDCGRGRGVSHFGGFVEGSSQGQFPCAISGVPGYDARYRYVLTARDPTPNTDLIRFTGETRFHDQVIAYFSFRYLGSIDDNVPWEDFYYTLTVTADNVDEASLDIHIYVINQGPDLPSSSPVVRCNAPGPVYEGSDDIALDCSVANEPSGATYAWTARGSTANTDLLSSTITLLPTFDVPDNVDADTDYEYRVTLSATGIDDVTEDVTVTILDRDRGALAVVCTDPGTVYEGSANVTLDCSASGAPGDNPQYAYIWTPRGDTQDTALLSATDIASPVFFVPDEVAATTTYEYLLTASAQNAESSSARVTVTVLNLGALSVVCVDPDSVYEGSENFALDCSASGAPAGSEYAYVWTAQGDTQDTSLLSAVDIASPVFYVPAGVDAMTTYEYLLTVSAEDAYPATANVTVTVLNKVALTLVCADLGSVHEGSDDITFDCSASGAPAGSDYTYAWTASGDTQDTSLLSAADIASPTFFVPDEVAATTTYEYLLTASAQNAESSSARITVTVLNTGALSVVCTDPGTVYEGSENFALDCSASGAPGDNPQYAYIWTPRGDTQDTALLSATDIASPTFFVPDEVAATTTYEYLLTASAQNAESSSARITVTVLNTGALSVVCTDPGTVYEGSENFALDCSASGAPGDNPQYAYIWTPRGDTQDTALLSATDIASPVFFVPDEVAATTTYEYLLTASAQNAESSSARVTVTVLNLGALSVVCVDPDSVYEGSENFALDCSASGAPAGSEYAYVWTAQGDTQDTSLLSAVDIASPVFFVPDEVAATTTYEYLLTASAQNAESSSARVTVTVLNLGALSVVCVDPDSVYEGSENFALDCSASGAPAGSEYAYVWTAQGDTQDTSLLSAVDIASPTFAVPDEVAATTTYEYLLTASAQNAESSSARITVTVLNTGALSVVCTDPGTVYEGSANVTLDCSASGAPGDNPQYAYIWTPRGDTQDTSLLSATDIASPTFFVPDEVAATTTYEYLLTASAQNAESSSARITVTVLNTGALSVVCTDPGTVYEGSANVTLDCSASGAPGDNPQYAYIWMPRGDTQDTALLSATDIASPVFFVPDEVAATTTYEYLLTASAQNAESSSARVTVTVLNLGALSVVCVDPDSVYEGSDDITFDCRAAGAPSGSNYTYTWTPRGDTQDTALLSATDIASPVFFVPDEVAATTTYKYLLTVSADNAEDATAEVAVTVLKRVLPPPPVSPPPVVSPPVAEEVTPGTPGALSTLSALGVTVSASPLRFGVQSSDTAVSLDPMTDGISTYVSGPYHAGRMTLSPDGSEALDENREMSLSIELASPVHLKRADAIEAASLVLSPNWSYAESCEQLSSQTIGGLYTEVTLWEDACRLLLFGGELDLTDMPSGRYTGSLDIILRSGKSEETFAVEVSVTVVPAQRVITIGPGGVRFSTSREVPVALTEEWNLSIYPDVALLTEEKPHEVFELSNPSLIPLEVSVSARFGYTEATEQGREVVVEDASGSHLSDLSEVVDIHPGVLVLQPGEKGLVRYGVKEEAHRAMAENGYAAFFDVVFFPRQYAALDRTTRVTMRVPGVYVPREGASQLRARLLSISYVGSMSATFLLETLDHPFVGEVVAYDGDGRELGRRETLVYTRSRVRIPLDRMPEEEDVFLRFAPRGSNRIPEPVFIEWNAQERDIGAAGDKGRTTTSQVLVQKP